ncbi:RNA-binding protein 45-like [Condylostylus longicornis]|uniref:RNA-binding protein 45-like n=1 Tax=Condylostylus longicornis TaxID=2530218 RepID=UPI00244DBAB5|nr:RNA-binding protein 45-like [Condylostylus longicornis]
MLYIDCLSDFVLFNRFFTFIMKFNVLCLFVLQFFYIIQTRFFELCSKTTTEESIRNNFSEYGTIEDIWIVKNKQSGENKGVAYVKFSKTSEAAAAQDELNGKTIDNEERPIKVLVASNRESGSGRSENEEERYLRLFIVVNKPMTKEEIQSEFEEYGDIEFVTFVKDKVTRESKGFAYVKYKNFTGAAKAYENCPQKYKAVFATPRSNDSYEDRRARPLKRPGRGMDVIFVGPSID